MNLSIHNSRYKRLRINEKLCVTTVAKYVRNEPLQTDSVGRHIGHEFGSLLWYTFFHLQQRFHRNFYPWLWYFHTRIWDWPAAAVVQCEQKKSGLYRFICERGTHHNCFKLNNLWSFLGFHNNQYTERAVPHFIKSSSHPCMHASNGYRSRGRIYIITCTPGACETLSLFLWMSVFLSFQKRLVKLCET